MAADGRDGNTGPLMTNRHDEAPNFAPIRCSICQRPIPDGTWAHTAEPVSNGRCCSKCNSRCVIPARIRRMRAEQSS
jgi:hypothetical protein